MTTRWAWQRVRIPLCVMASVWVATSPPTVQAGRLFRELDAGGTGARHRGGPERVELDALVARELRREPRPRELAAIPVGGGERAAFAVVPIEVFTPDATVVAVDGHTRRPLGRPDVAIYEGYDLRDPARTLVLGTTSDTDVFALVRAGSRVTAAIVRAAPRSPTDVSYVVVAPAGAGPSAAEGFCDASLVDQGLPHPDTATIAAEATGTATTLAAPPGPTLAAEVLLDVDYDLFSGPFGSDTTRTAQYVASLFGAMSAIYRRDVNVAVLVSELVVWTAPDPFATAVQLDQLLAYRSYNMANRPGVSRDVALLLQQGASGIAYRGGLCSTSTGYALTRIGGTESSFATTGWVGDVNLIAHELGHVFGSPHTHCYEPPLDHCYASEAGCYSGPVEGSTGESMSYCFGYDIEMGFGTVVGRVIRSGAERGSCIGAAPGVCGNGVSDPGEQCDDGNVADGDCCSSRCVYDSSFVYCATDGDPCTSDVCNGAGVCTHVAPGLCSACGTPTTIPAAGGTFTGTTTGASTISGSCGGSGPERVFRWTPSTSGLVTLTTCGSGFNTVLHVRTDACDVGPEAGCNNDACGQQSRVTLLAEAGRTYFLVVDGYGGGSGAFTLTVPQPSCGNGVLDGADQCEDGNLDDGDCCSGLCGFEPTTSPCASDGDPCTSDACDGAGTCTHVPPGSCGACGSITTIAAEGGTFSGSATGASTLAGTCGAAGPERVYQWTPAGSGSARIGVGCDDTAVVYVREASCSAGPELACAEQCQTLWSVPVQAGTTYFIVVDARYGSSYYDLRVDPPVVCGDGIIMTGEECDDGNTDANDGCTNACTLCGNGVVREPEGCDDGNLTADDGCTPACVPACPAEPLAGCRLPVAPGKSSVQLKDNADDAKDMLKWAWTKGATTPKADFGSPFGSDGYELCVYEAAGAAVRLSVRPGPLCPGCWKATTPGFVHKAPDGTKLTLKEGLVEGKAVIKAGAKGAGLALPALPTLGAPLRVQLIRHGGPCWEATFSAPFLKQDAKMLKDTSD